jgi:hypothetical protein
VLPGSAYEAVEREDEVPELALEKIYGGIKILRERKALDKDMGNVSGLLGDQGVYQ